MNRKNAERVEKGKPIVDTTKKEVKPPKQVTCDFLIHELELEDNGLRDKSFAALIKMLYLYDQHFQMLKHLSYKQNELGPESLQAMQELV